MKLTLWPKKVRGDGNISHDLERKGKRGRGGGDDDCVGEDILKDFPALFTGLNLAKQSLFCGLGP